MGTRRIWGDGAASDPRSFALAAGSRWSTAARWRHIEVLRVGGARLRGSAPLEKPGVATPRGYLSVAAASPRRRGMLSPVTSSGRGRRIGLASAGRGESVVDVIGRAAERAELGAFADAVEGRPAALSLEGGASVGQDHAVLSGLQVPRERGCRVLAARPAAAEAGLGFAGLADLFGGVLDEVLDVLPSPQAEALRVAFLLERPRAPLDQRVVGCRCCPRCGRSAARTRRSHRPKCRVSTVSGRRDLN
jgi:hypothetical protein